MIFSEYNKSLLNWFNEKISNDESASDTIKWISYMTKFNVLTWTAYNISTFSFFTKSKGDYSTMKNNMVIVDVESMYFSSSKYKNLVMAYRP